MLTMMDLVRYLKKVQLARLEQIAQHFQQKPALIEGMLSVLIQQKKVVCHNNPLTCGKSCAGCPSTRSEPVYCWNQHALGAIPVKPA